jgi:very-short-patch-repair endonuclease
VAHDENRDQYLLSRGYEILRFPNDYIFQSPSAVLDAICNAALKRGWQPLGR